MTYLLDTSFLVRYLSGRPAEIAAIIADVIDGPDPLLVTDVVIAETAYVLTSVYQLPREAVVDLLVALLRKANINVFRLDKALVLEALLLCRPSGRVSFADAMLWAAARSVPDAAVYSLDERFPDDGIRVLRSASGA